MMWFFYFRNDVTLDQCTAVNIRFFLPYLKMVLEIFSSALQLASHLNVLSFVGKIEDTAF